VDYVEVFDAKTLRRATNLKRPSRLAAAVFLGHTRLIDNIPLPKKP
jgi:pantothenate synthetase